MALRTFGGGPADVTSDTTGQVVGGIQLKVFNAPTGGQRVTELYSIDGEPLSGVVTSSNDTDKLGRVEFAADEAYSVLFLDPGYGMRWVVPSREAFRFTAAAVAKADEAIELARNAATKTDLDAKFLNPATFPTVYPHQFGASGDGSTDDTDAVQAAVDYLDARGGGVLSYDPSWGAGVYVQNDVRLAPNLTINGNGATIRSTRYAVFHGSSGTGKGYGSYTKNLTIRDLVFEGDFGANRQAAITFHHAENVLIENCTWEEAHTAGHCLDLCGCKNVTIRSCRFLGHLYSGRHHAEAIQIDHSTANGLDNKDPAGTYDGLPCVNITVEDSTFDQLVKGGTTYEAPTPFGNHVHVGQLHRGIRFLRNYVRGAHYVTTAANANGWIHTYGVDGFEIAGNTFESTPEKSMIVVRVHTQTLGIAPSGYGIHNSPYVEIGAVPSSKIRITGNTFKGFATDDSLAVISIEGLADKHVYDVLIEGNQFTHCYPESRKASGGNFGGDPINLSYVSGAIVRGNTMRGVRRVIFAENCEHLTVDANAASDVYWTAIVVGASRSVLITRNTLSRYVGGILTTEAGCTNGTIHGNVLIDSQPAEGLWTGYMAPIFIRSGARVSVIGNIIESTTPPAFQAAQAIKFTGTHTGGLYGSNLQAGHTKEATVDTGSTVTAK